MQFSHAEGNITVSVRETMRVYCGSGGVRGPIMFYNDYPVNWGEPVISCSTASMTYNYKTEEIKWITGSRMPA